MKKLYWTGSLLALTIHTQAQAAVVDQFHCSLQFFDHEGQPGPKTDGTFSAVREPVAPNPLWIPGVTASKGHFVISLGGPEIYVAHRTEYTLFHSRAKGKVAQEFCAYIWTGKLKPTADFEPSPCAFTTSPYPFPGQPPFDPTDLNPLTQTNDAGTPLFLSSDLKPQDIVLDTFLSPWGRAHAECVFIRTIE